MIFILISKTLSIVVKLLGEGHHINRYWWKATVSNLSIGSQYQVLVKVFSLSVKQKWFSGTEEEWGVHPALRSGHRHRLLNHYKYGFLFSLSSLLFYSWLCLLLNSVIIPWVYNSDYLNWHFDCLKNISLLLKLKSWEIYWMCLCCLFMIYVNTW